MDQYIIHSTYFSLVCSLNCNLTLIFNTRSHRPKIIQFICQMNSAMLSYISYDYIPEGRLYVSISKTQLLFYPLFWFYIPLTMLIWLTSVFFYWSYDIVVTIFYWCAHTYSVLLKYVNWNMKYNWAHI